METIANALLPLLVLLISGLVLRRIGFLEQPFWDQAENLTYYFLMPVLLVRTIAGSHLGDVPWADMVWSAYGATIATAMILLLGYALLGSRDHVRVFTSVFQGSVRFNTYIALSLIEAIFGATGIAIGGLVAGFLIVLANLLSVGMMSAVLHTGTSLSSTIFRGLARNPLIIACLVGGGINFVNIAFPVWIDASLALVSRMALPVALLCVGASLSLRRLKGDLKPALIASIMHLGLKPAMAFGLAVILGLTGMHLTIVVIFMAVPTAVSSYILARKLGGDQEAMATIITFQTILAFVTLTMVLIGLQVHA